MAAWLPEFTRHVLCRLGVVMLVLGVAAPQVNADLFDDLGKLLKEPPRPDLVVTSVQLDRPQADAGQTVRATINITNTGRGRARSTRLALSAAPATASASGTYSLATADLGTLGGNTSLTYVSTFTVPNVSQAGTYRIVASLTTPTAEPRRDNNTGQASLDIRVSSTSTAQSSPAALPSAVAAATPTAASAFQAPCDYYASPNGTGNGLTSGSPFRIGNFWPIAAPGKTLCLMDGTYQGAAQMITPPSGLSGSSGRPITIRALNDGAVTIDGQFTNNPIVINNNSWLIIEGINAKSAATLWHGVMSLWGLSSNNIFRRLVLSDARLDANVAVMESAPGNISGVNNLFEDFAAFGTGRKMFVGGTKVTGAPAGAMTCRRCWFRGEGSIVIQGGVLSMGYDAFGFRCENCIVTATGESMPESFDVISTTGQGVIGRNTNFNLPGGDYAFLYTDGQRSASTKCQNSELLGSLIYLPTAFIKDPSQSGLTYLYDSCMTARHVYTLVHPSHPAFSTQRGYSLQSGDAGFGTAPATPGTQFATNITSVRSASAGESVASSWNRGSGSTGWSVGESVGAVASVWTNSGPGANLCKRWVNGVVTNEPLWPWPMNQRIKDATESAGAYLGPCANCTGGRRVRRATDVTAEVEAMLGTIPSQCKVSP